MVGAVREEAPPGCIRDSGGQNGLEMLGSTDFAGSVDTVNSIRRQGDERTITPAGSGGAELADTVLLLDERGWVTATGKLGEARALRGLNHDIPLPTPA